MKAMACTAYGSPEVVELREVEKPTPAHDQVLIKVYASTVNIGDCRVRSFDVRIAFWLPYRLNLGLTKLKQPILGATVAGEIEAVGEDVRRFKEGDRVYGMDIDGRGAHAEYMCRSEEGALALMPANTTFEEAAAVPHGALTALTFLRDKGHVHTGQKVLINGASGAVGTAAVQIAKHLGAEVTGVCSSANLELVRTLGADQVIDYRQEDFTRSGRTYDVIFDAVGKSSFARCRDSLEQGGTYLATDPGLAILLSMVWTSMVGNQKAIWALGPERAQDLECLTDLIEAGKLRAVIDRRYALEQIAEAHRYVEKGHTKGNVVVTVEHLN